MDNTSHQTITDEIELFGCPLSEHPLELYQETLNNYEFVSTSKMHWHVDRNVQMVGWLITEKFAETNHGQPMEFTTFEDLTGLYDATFFPKTFQKYDHLLAGGKPHIVEGLVEEDIWRMYVDGEKNRGGELSGSTWEIKHFK